MKSLLIYVSYFLWLAALIVVLAYVIPLSPPFPNPPPGAVQSEETGDKEDFKNRRAYFIDLPRQEIMEHYQRELSTLTWNNFTMTVPTYRLNYPPEDAMIFIKELTRSVFLEEVVNPFRESFFINGFEPKEAKDAIIIDGREFQRKITVRYYRSQQLVRIVIVVLTFGIIFILLREWNKVKNHND